MTCVVTFNQDKAVYTDSASKEHEVFSIIPHMNDIIEIEEGTLFRHIWSFIERDANLLSMIFSGALGHFHLQEWIPLAHEDLDKSDDRSIEHLEIYWDAQLTGERFEIGPGLHGVGPYKDGSGELISDQAYAIDFTPINELMDFPIRLRENFDMINSPENILSPDDYSLTPCKREFTVYDLLYAILYEISFFGDPKRQKESLESMMQDLAEFEKSLENDDAEGCPDCDCSD